MLCCVQSEADDHMGEVQKAVATLQMQVKSEREKFVKMKTDLHATKNSSHSHEAQVHLLTIQVNDLQVGGALVIGGALSSSQMVPVDAR